MNSELRLRTRPRPNENQRVLHDVDSLHFSCLEDVSIVIPTYNEAGRLASSMKSLLDEVPGSRTCEVIVVDDGSSDDTCQVALTSLEPFDNPKLVSLPENRGKGAAIRCGLQSCTRESVVIMDADMASSPTWLNDAIALLHANEDLGLVIGSRAHPDSRIGAHPLHRTIAGRVFNSLTRALSGLQAKDTQCGSKAVNGSLAALMSALCSVEGFAFDVEAILLARALGYEVEELPVEWHHVQGSHVRWMRDPLVMTLEVAKARRRIQPESPVASLRVTWSRARETSKEHDRQALADLLMRQLRAGTLVISTNDGALIVRSEGLGVPERDELERVGERLRMASTELKVEPCTLTLAELGEGARKGRAWLVPSRQEKGKPSASASISSPEQNLQVSKDVSTTTKHLTAC